jgi:hypothetical protein
MGNQIPAVGAVGSQRHAQTATDAQVGTDGTDHSAIPVWLFDNAPGDGQAA